MINGILSQMIETNVLILFSFFLDPKDIMIWWVRF